MKDNATNAQVYSTIAHCFANIDEQDWEDLTQKNSWEAFLENIIAFMHGGKSLSTARPPRFEDMPSRLEEVLSSSEVQALHTPPTYAEKQAFAARHFVGGLPTSAPPVESLYENPFHGERHHHAFPDQQGMYRRNSAHYMEALIENMALTLPAEYQAYPDHLALELDMLALLESSGLQTEARAFMHERLDWLTAYRMRLLELGEEARFFLALIDVLLSIRSAHIAPDDSIRD